MPPRLLFDLSQIDLDGTLHDLDVIRQHNPQRGEMEHLDAIVWSDGPCVLGRKRVREDEFWIPGHIPGRPLMPGVILMEAAAQVCSFHTATYVGWDGFIGFGGMEDVKFRASVEPGQTLYILCELFDQRHRRVKGRTQGLVGGNIVFEGVIIGTKM